MSAEIQLPTGIYEQLVDEELGVLLESRQDLIASIVGIEDESEPHTYSQFLSQLLHQALPILKSAERLPVINRLIALLSAVDGLDYTKRKQLLSLKPTLLQEIRTKGSGQQLPRPGTSIRISSLLTGSTDDPQLEHELRSEMMSADRVDILVSFIKWSGLRLLVPAFESLAERGVEVRIITTSYMGASDPEAIEWLAAKPGICIKVSYDTDRTRLHAKAYHFVRKSGFSTAYIGSANMSRAAMTSGLEWTVKVTAQDMPHIMAKFGAEFETYWAQDEFVLYDPNHPARFREAIRFAQRTDRDAGPMFFADIRPYAFQERIFDALIAARQANSFKNLVIAATGTGKTVMAAFDYARFRRENPTSSRLLFVVHRKEILQQARGCFRSILRDQNFGELLVDGEEPSAWNHVFASVQSLTHRKLWERFGASHYHFIILDEAHHGAASSYRTLFTQFQPSILLGLTATPERMDGSSILPDFDDRFAAEIRLPEALEEKLLCPFHYFGVADSVDVSEERFWRNGKYDTTALTDVYTGDDIRALERVDLILQSLRRYQPNLSRTRGVGFCASVRHAKFMAEKFRAAGFTAEEVLGETPGEERDQRVQAFRAGRLSFLFTVDVFSEGVDIPEIDLVMFLRPTESLTVFLQQLGRGLRHAPEKDCLTVLDFVGQSHPKYRMDRKFSALLRTQRRRIDLEIERDFPNLPPGCNIQLERVARERILQNIKQSLGNLNNFIPEAIRTFEAETHLPLTFANFVETTALTPLEILRNKTWSEWKNIAYLQAPVRDPDLEAARKALRRICLRTDPTLLDQASRLCELPPEADSDSLEFTEAQKAALHYTLWGKKGSECGVGTYQDSFDKWRRNHHSASDVIEVAKWRRTVHPFTTNALVVSKNTSLNLHAAYGLAEIKAAFGLATIDRSGPAGTGVIHIENQLTYIHLVTFRKEDRDFAPTTRYKDYLISRSKLHWESQAAATQSGKAGQNYIHFQARSYTILFFARIAKSTEGETSPFIFLGPAANLLSYDGNRPIAMVWELTYPVPAALFEEARVR
jgi:superfamily II DNA or RNA helicase